MDHTRIHLTSAELALLVELAGATTIPSLGSQPYRTGDPAQIARLRDAAGQALVERGLLTVDGAALATIDSALKAAVLTCVYPQSILSALSRYRTAALPRAEAYYIIPDLAVYHQPGAADAHTLTVLAPVPDFQSMVAERFQGMTVAPGAGGPLAVPLAAFNAIQSAAKSQTAEAIAQLLRKYAGAAAPALAAALVDPLLRCVLEWSSAGRTATFACLVAESGSWIVEGLDNPHGRPVELVPMTVAALEEALAAVFAQERNVGM